ncbi:MAG: hypothetical protein AAB554_00805 [Patescibacteria group bacterium]
MRPIPLALACALVLACCGGAPRGVSKPDRPVIRAVVAPIEGGRAAVLVTAGVWAPLDRKAGDPIVLQHQDVRGAAIALYFREAELNSVVEDEVNRWAMMMLSAPMVFRVTGVTNPVYPSDSEGSFTLEGEDKGVKMAAKCLIRHLGDPTADYWVLIFSVSPASMKAEAFAEVDKISKSLKLVPPKRPQP